jgi:hypothetical protein
MTQSGPWLSRTYFELVPADCRAASYLNCMDIRDELLEEAKYAAITILAVAILFGMSVGIALFFHFV